VQLFFLDQSEKEIVKNFFKRTKVVITIARTFVYQIAFFCMSKITLWFGQCNTKVITEMHLSTSVIDLKSSDRV